MDDVTRSHGMTKARSAGRALLRAALPALLLAGSWAWAQASYSQAPILDPLVASGELPPVEERLPENPLLVEVVEETGQYGGVWRQAFLGPSDANSYVRIVYDALVRFSPDGSTVEPKIAASWDVSDDFSAWTLHLRPGARWSDGAPFTADDIMFWYEDTILNTDLTPSVPSWFRNPDGSAALVERIDDYTVRYTFAQPNTLFLIELANQDGADRRLASFLPKHYLSQFHPAYVAEADLQALVQGSSYANWVDHFMNKATPAENPERPTMGAWVPSGSTVGDAEFVLRRNPYYIGVDAAGQQLPYLDEVRFRYFSSIETLNFAAVAGEFDLQARHIEMTNYPVLIENQQRGGYRIITWPTYGGSDAAITFNQSYVDDPALGELLRNRDFRVALSYAINRDEIREAAFLGLGEPRQSVPAPWHPFYPGDELAARFTEFDPEQANAMLDAIGLDQRDGQGYRTLPGGGRLAIEITVVPSFGPWSDVGQLVAQDWENVGVRTNMEIRERAFATQLRDSNSIVAEVWNNTNTGFPFSGQPRMDPRRTVATAFASTPFRQWYASGGEQGMEPPIELQRIVQIMQEAMEVDEARQVELAHELFEIWVDQQWEIGTIGLSPMVQGVVVINADLRNVPDLLANDWPLRTPGNARPEQFFYQRP